MLKKYIYMYAILIKRPALVILLLLTYTSHAQQAASDFVKINKAYQGLRSLDMKVEYTLYKSWSSAEVLESEKGEIRKKGVYNFYTRVGTTETFQNKDYFFIVNHDDRQMLLLDVFRAGRKDAPQLLFNEIDTLLKFCSSVNFSREASGLHAYTLNFSQGMEYGKLKIVFDPSTYYISKICFYFNKPVQILSAQGEELEYKARLEINYSGMRGNARLLDIDFTYDKYLFQEKGILQLRDTYRSYTFMNQLSNKSAGKKQKGTTQ